MEIDKICKQLAKELDEDYDFVKEVVMFEFQFIIDVMKDENDYHDILLAKLFRFALKPRFKEDKTKDYTPR